MEQAGQLEGHFNAVPVTVSVAETTTAEGERDFSINGDAEADPDLGAGNGNGGASRLGGDRQRIVDEVKASPPLVRRVKVSQQSTAQVDVVYR